MNKTPLPSNGVVFARPGFLHAAAGPVTIPMTNDYLFHALLQNDNEALKGLICSLLHLRPAEVESVVVTNPIELGAYIDVKDFVLDIKILLNNRTIINLELQVINRHNWPERSLSYLCRVFDSLNPAENYQKAKPAIHIGLLDFTLFPDEPEFYATNMMMNIKTYRIYSDKLRLSVLDLTRKDLATEEDKLFHIDSWAALFKATTWEEIKMIAQKDENIAKAANTIWKLSQEEKIRLQCEAREDFYRNQRDMQDYMEMQTKEITQQNNIIALQTREITSKNKTISEQELELAKQSGTISQQEQEIARQSGTISQQELEIARQREELNKNTLHQTTVLLQQIRNFHEKNFSLEECANMLGMEISLVELVYTKLQTHPETDNASILNLLKDKLSE